jgi:SHS family sialic acid transporter-like MFS transporter
MSSSPNVGAAGAELSSRGRQLVLWAAFLGWMFAGVEMQLVPLATRSAIKSFIADGTLAVTAEATVNDAAEPDVAAEDGTDDTAVAQNKIIGQWFVKYIAAFLLGAALGGLLFGWLGDQAGRTKAMGVSILWYSIFTGFGYVASSAEQLMVLRFFACMGIGGMWPNGVALVAEAWSDVSRPMLAGLIGTAANVGITVLGVVSRLHPLTEDSWRWLMLVGALPAVLGVLVLWRVPESPRWLAGRAKRGDKPRPVPVAEVFRPPLLRLTLFGIALGTIPLLGAWGASKWYVLWADRIGSEIGEVYLKSDAQIIWGIGASIGSLAGGWLASRLGRRMSYFLVSLGAVLISAYLFRATTPGYNAQFMVTVFLLGLVPTIYFGWLPFYLPELFPTRVRATGAGVAFNFGRIISAAVTLSTVGLVAMYQGKENEIGAVGSLIYVLGMIVIWFAPMTDHTIRDD